MISRHIYITAFCLFAFLFTVSDSPAAEIRLEGDTSEPRHSLFIPGQPVVLKFVAGGLPPDTGEHLLLNIEDEHARPVYERAIALQPGKEDGLEVRYEPSAAGNPADGIWKINLHAPTNRLGFYKVNARLSGGVELAGLCSRPPGFLTYAIVPDPSLRREFPAQDTFFGMMGAVEPGIMGQSWQVHNYGMYCWKAFEPDNPEQFSDKVRSYEEEEARGGWAGMPYFEGRLHYYLGGKSGSIPSWWILPIGNPPYWAARNETRGHNSAALTREGEQAWREFCLKLGAWMAEKRASQKLHYYQVTAEPEIPWGYKGTNAELVRIYEIAWQALHEADPHAMVAGPGFSLDNFGQLEEMLQLGFADFVDVLDFHPYMGGNVLPSEFGLVSKIRQLKELILKYTDKLLPMTGTEAGFDASGEDTQTWLRMAWSDIQHNLILLGEGFWFNVGFHGADNSRDPYGNTWGHAYNLDPQRDYGVQKTSPKPVVAAYATMSLLLEGHKTAGSLEWLGESVTGYAYAKDQSVVLALWSDQPTQIRLPAGSEEVLLTDWMGNSSRVECPAGVLELTLSNDPSYVSGVAPELWCKGSDKKTLLVREELIRVFPGDAFSVNCFVLNSRTAEMKAHLSCHPARGSRLADQDAELRIAPGSGTSTTFEFEIPQDGEPGEYTLSFVLSDGITPLAGAGTVVVVEQPVHVESVLPLLKGESCGVSVTLRAPAERKAVGKIVLSQKDAAAKELPFDLGAGERNEFELLWPATGQAPFHLQGDLVITVGEGADQRRSFSFSAASASPMPAVPVTDGDLQEWQHLPALYLGKNEVTEGVENWRGVDDASARVWLAWDAAALYLACQITDDQHYQKASQMPFYTWDDSLMVAVNLDPLNVYKAGGDRVEGGVLKRWHEFIMALDDSDGGTIKAARIGSYDMRFAPSEDLDHQKMPHAISRRGSDTCYEISIPWKLLGAIEAPQPGDVIGFSIWLRDLDEINGERKGKVLQLFGGILPARNLAEYGWIIMQK